MNANNRIYDVSFVNKRISIIYIPYLITLILAIPLHIINATLEEGLNAKLLIGRLIINIGMIVAKHFSLDKGIVVLPLTILFFSISMCGACLIHNFAEWLLSFFEKNNKHLITSRK